MVATAITKQAPPGKYPASITALAADYTWTTADVANSNYFTSTGREILLVWNQHATLARTVTISSVRDPSFHRLGDITTLSIAAGEIRVFGPFKAAGWVGSDKKLTIAGSTTDIKFAVDVLPSFN